MICSLNKLVHLEKKRVNSEMYIDVINMREMNRVIPPSMHQNYVPLHFEMQFNNVYPFMKE